MDRQESQGGPVEKKNHIPRRRLGGSISDTRLGADKGTLVSRRRRVRPKTSLAARWLETWQGPKLSDLPFADKEALSGSILAFRRQSPVSNLLACISRVCLSTGIISPKDNGHKDAHSSVTVAEKSDEGIISNNPVTGPATSRPCLFVTDPANIRISGLQFQELLTSKSPYHFRARRYDSSRRGWSKGWNV